MAKISQIKLTNTTYDIDVASDLKATKIIGEDSAKIPPVEAIQKPDGVNPLFDENNKISSHYINDTILGQLKFGGTLTSYNFFDGSYIVNPSQLILSKLYELTNYSSATHPINSLRLGRVGDPSYVSIDMRSDGITQNGYNDAEGTAFEGFYFISAANLSDGHAVGDWLVINNKNFEKIDNTDTITHIDETDGDSLLEITGTSGLKLNGIRKNEIGIELTSNLYTQSNGCITCGGSLYGGSISGGSIAASSKMTAPTITDASDKTQVVNLDYFENNATKVDWENIDSEVHIINNHNVEIDGGLVVHGKTGQDLLVAQSADPENIESKCINSLVYEVSCSNEPYVDLDGTTSWINDESLTAPYWITFPITQGYSYRVFPLSTNSAPCWLVHPSTAAENSYGYHLVLSATHEGGTLNKVGYTYTPSDSDDEWYRKGTLEFTADISGYAYIPMSNTTGFGFGILDSEVSEANIWRVCETPKHMSGVKINGDLEITGDLSFGADSHLVFGTIEGTDFIADYAKVKNAPVEDDDVVNLKTLKEWVPSTTKTAKLFETTVSKNSGTPQTVYELEADEAVAGTYSFEFATANGISIIKSHLDYSPTGVVGLLGTIIDEWAITACTPPAVGSTTTYPVGVGVGTDGAMTFIIDFCSCESFEGDNLNNMRFTIYGPTRTSGGSSDISNYQGNAKINGNLEVTGNLSFEGDLEMSSIEAQSIKINGKRVLTEDDLANLVAYPAAEDYTF